MDHEKPGSPGDILAHHGIKGMKWGVRKQDDSGGDGGKTPKEKADHNAQTKAHIAALSQMPTVSLEQGRANFKRDQQKFLEKFEPSEPKPSKGSPGRIEGVTVSKEKGGLTPGQKKALLAAGGIAVTAGALYLARGQINSALLKRAGVATFADIDALAGKPIDPHQFTGLVGLSQGKTWFGGKYITESALTRPAFELPAGHTFHRLSTTAESGFKDATYSLHSVDDYNRYVAGFRQEIGNNLHHVTWQTKHPTKVPDLTTVLGQMSEVLKDEGQPHGIKETQRAYTALSGTSWSTSRSTALIKRLKGLGYGALVDEMDAGVIGETPLVFFGHEQASPKKVKKLSMDDIKKAEVLLKEINKPPGRKY